jgi:adenylate kinase family enzyme
VVGNAGSGKSTLAAALADHLELPYIELDAIYHQRHWQPLPTEQFRKRVEALISGDSWVVDGNYSDVLEQIWRRADTVIWLDLPRRIVMRQLIVRTIIRVTQRVELWNGNRERLRNLLARDPAESVIVWAWHHHIKYYNRYSAATNDPVWSHLHFHRLTSRNDARHLLEWSTSP